MPFFQRRRVMYILNLSAASVQAYVPSSAPPYEPVVFYDLILFSGAIGKQVLVGLGIQVLFVFALASAGMAIVRYQQQER